MILECSHVRHGQGKIKLSYFALSVLTVWTQLATRQDSLSCLHPVSNFQLFSLKYIEDYWKLGNWKLSRDKTKLSCLVLSAVVFTLSTQTRQDKTILSCPCRRCEQAITVIKSNCINVDNWHTELNMLRVHITAAIICCCCLPGP